MEQTPHIVILPSPGLGHLIPLAEFAKKLVHEHNFTFTFIIPTCAAPSIEQKSILEALSEGIDHIFLNPIIFKERFQGIEAATQVALTVARSLPSFADAFRKLVTKKSVVALITDGFGTSAFDVAKEFEVPAYVFFVTSTMSLCWSMCLPQYDEMVLFRKEISEPVHIPGCVSVSRSDFMVDPIQHRHTEAYQWTLYHCRRFNLADGIIVNTFLDLEPGPIEALQKLFKTLVYPIGPIVRARSVSGPTQPNCLEWLDSQPRDSVLFVSFGSGGTLSCDQLCELAMGLEMSEQRFLWVVKNPSDCSHASYFSLQTQDDPLAFLPKGFVNRTKDRAMVVPSWGPQAEVLRHDSTGGFITHCGWNSIQEAISNGVPLIVWPLFCEQKMNAVMLVDGLKVAIKLRVEQSGIVGRDEIAEVVKGLIKGDEGKELRDRMLRLKNSAMKALGEDGSSTKALLELAYTLKKNVRSVRCKRLTI